MTASKRGEKIDGNSVAVKAKNLLDNFAPTKTFKNPNFFVTPALSLIPEAASAN